MRYWCADPVFVYVILIQLLLNAGSSCVDIDECTLNTAGCHETLAVCKNTIGSSQCSCKQGYTGNGVFCVDVDECLVNNGNCSMNGTCTNTEGSSSCACKKGYSGDGLTCSDIGECSTSNGGCHQQATCTNTAGSRKCACKVSVTLFWFTHSGLVSCYVRHWYIRMFHFNDWLLTLSLRE